MTKKQILFLIVISIVVFVFSYSIAYLSSSKIESTLIQHNEKLSESKELIYEKPTEAFTIKTKIALVFGITFTILFIMGKFLTLALKKYFVMKKTSAFLIPIILCFLIGVLYANFVLIPNSLTTLYYNTDDPSVINISDYINHALKVIIVTGFIFNLSLIFFTIFPKKYRKYNLISILLILIFSIILFPFNLTLMLLFFGPSILFNELISLGLKNMILKAK